MKYNFTPDYNLIGKAFKQMSIVIVLYFSINLILYFVPKIFPNEFFTKNMYELIFDNQENINRKINNYKLLDFISDFFFFIMISVISSNLYKIGKLFDPNKKVDESFFTRYYTEPNKEVEESNWVATLVSYIPYFIIIIIVIIYNYLTE